MVGAHISREKGLSGWLGRVFLEKKACLDGWGAYFSRKRLASMAGVRISREKGLVLRAGALLGNPGNQSRIFIHGFRLQFLRKSCHFGQLVWGGPSGPPKARIQRNLAQSAQPIWIPAFSSGNTQSLSAYPCFLREIRKVYLRTLVFFEKYAKFICVPLFPPRNLAQSICVPMFFFRKRHVWMTRTHISREKGLFGWLGLIFLEK